MTSRTPPAAARTRRSSRPTLLALLVVAVVYAIVGGALAVQVLTAPASAPTAPHPQMPLAVSTDSLAVEAAASHEGSPDAKAAAVLASRPTAHWLTPERFPLGVVGERVRALLQSASEQQAAATVVVYGLPDRDCGQHSTGGLDASSYAEWTTEIGDALRTSTTTAIVILEPDSLALSVECDNATERFRQLRLAVGVLQAPHAWIYLDGGHSRWLPPSEMARLISSVGVLDQVRGFATNVSNFNRTAQEATYAHEVSAYLGGTHAVIDTSRNGAGSNGEWCNPPGRRIGEDPATSGDDVVDLNLWIKPPGESDGACNGGPASGTWWPAAAIELARGAR